MTEHIYWKGDSLYVLDQRLLPFKETYLKCATLKDVVSAIRDMAVRGAPLIGIVAAYGMTIGIREIMEKHGRLRDSDAERVCHKLKETRPTAVNLFWALRKMRDIYHQFKGQDSLVEAMLKAALDIHTQDKENNEQLSRYGSELIDDGDTILTHCNAGALATGGYGTALGVIRAAFEAGKQIQVVATETRPYFQGARLTVWELKALGIDVTLVPDNHAGLLLGEGIVDKVIVGADRIARNGDVANKIGTYMIALAAHDNEVPFYVAAPLSSFDETIKNGEEIDIEERDGREVKYVNGRLVTLKNVVAKYYGFDVTPARLITYIITESGVIEKPFGKYVKMLFAGANVSIITVLTDFGLKDPYVGIMKGVMLSINPGLNIVDISHEVDAQAVKEGSFLIDEYYRYFAPGTVHLCVVDPTVGSSRKPLIVTRGEHTFVGPDNGLFTRVLTEEAAAHEISNSRFILPHLSGTFHGRDVFAPAAAHLTQGTLACEFGPPVAEPVKLDDLLPSITEDVMTGEIVRIDRFGNAISNIALDAFSTFMGTGAFLIELDGLRFDALNTSYYENRYTCLIGSSGYLEFGSFLGNLAREKSIDKGDAVRARRLAVPA